MTVASQTTAVPPAPEPGNAPAPQPGRATILAVAAAFVVGATVLQLVRQPRIPTWNSLWQEDGTVFLTGALNHPLHSITTTYNGYLHVVPRLLALGLAQLSLHRTPLLFSGATALIASLVAVYTYVVGRGIYRTRWAPAALAVLLVGLPAAAYEVNADLANLHWYLLFGAFWALMDRPPTRARAGLAFLVALAAAVSDTLAGLLVPLGLFRAIRGGRRERAAPLGLLVGLVLQLVFTSAGPKPYTRVVPSQLPATYGLRVVGSFLFGDHYLLRIYGWGGNVLALLLLFAALAAMVAAVLLMHRDGRADARLLAVAASILSLAYLMIPLLVRGTYLLHQRTLNGARYEVLPVMFLATVVLLLIDRVELGPGRLARFGPRVLVSAVGLAVIAINLPTPAVRSLGPAWNVELQAAAALCRGGIPVAPAPVRFAAGHRDIVRIPVAPASSTKVPFPAAVPCSRVG